MYTHNHAFMESDIILLLPCSQAQEQSWWKTAFSHINLLQKQNQIIRSGLATYTIQRILHFSSLHNYSAYLNLKTAALFHAISCS